MRKNLVAFFFLLGSPTAVFSQYWQQRVNYTIDVSLNDKDNELDAFEKIEYTNNSPDTLRFIWFHIWPNAYKNDRTAFSDQMLENGNTKFYFSGKEEKGYINRLDFKVNNSTALTEDHPHYIDIIKLVLPGPLAPGEKIIISTPFHVKLPFNFSRSGYDGQSYQATQWYPKPAVYDAHGWHPMPYLDQGEYYSEYGDFDVRITIPKNYVVAATGELQNEDEKKWLKTRSGFNWQPIHHKEKIKGGVVKTTTQLFPESAATTKTIEYKQSNIHDFAWFADKRFIVKQDTCRLASGKVIHVFTFYTPAQQKPWQNSIRFCKDAIRHYSRLVGEYPYNVVSAVQGPASFGGGMEYPTITLISPDPDPKTLDNTIAHEIGHNWFYGILGSNERDHPWMDEGINSYYDNKYALSKNVRNQDGSRLFFETRAVNKTDQPVNLPADRFSDLNYTLVVYYKTSEWLRYLELQLGTPVFNKSMQEYYRQWQYKHPQPEDFKKSIEESSGKNLDSVFSLLDKKGELPNQQTTGSKLLFVYKPGSLNSYIKSPSKNLFLAAPAIGVNTYDKIMAGGIFTNFKLPPSRLQFLAIPMYSTGAKRLVGLGLVNYSFYPDHFFRKIVLSTAVSRFSMDEFNSNNGEKVLFGFQKLVPGIKFILKEKDPRSAINRFVQFKSFMIREDNLSFYRDTVITGIDTSFIDRFRTIKENRTLNQLQFVIENNRALYPYRGELKIEEGKDFVRAGFTGNYFFNYPKNGGLDLRLFAGKFFYTADKTSNAEFETDRYHLNLTGADGYEDYTYSDYFVGRNKFLGIISQQIMVRDGGFKIRTDLLADKVGKTDDWVAAINLNTTIPDNINPLSLLPVNIPIKIFADIGTYAAAWAPGATLDRFLFDAGIHIPIFKETVNIYLPILYSKIYSDYIKSTIYKNRLLKTLSFSIDISHFTLRKLNRNFDF